MLETYSYNEGCGGGTRILTLPDVKEEIRSSREGKCWDVKNLERREIVFSHRFDILLHTTPAQLKSLVQNAFHRILRKEFNLAGQNLVKTDGYEHYSGTALDFSYPIETRFLGGDQYTVIRQVSEPFLLRDGTGKDSFAAITSYEIVGSHLPGNYYHSAPAIKKGGIPLVMETKKLIQCAAPQISVSLPFTEREWDVIEELTRGKTKKEICDKLGISPSTIEWDHFRNIRSKCKNLGLEVSPFELAEIFREFRVC